MNKNLNHTLNEQTRHIAFIAMLVCLAMVLSYVERLIPLNFTIPGMKLGLANLVILIGLYLLPWRQALLLVLVKCLMTAWIFGSFSAFLYSVSGSLLSFLVMSLLVYLTEKKMDQKAPVFISILGAVTHNAGQIFMALILLKSVQVLYYFPILVLTGAVTGCFIGLCAKSILLYFKETPETNYKHYSRGGY